MDHITNFYLGRTVHKQLRLQFVVPHTPKDAPKFSPKVEEVLQPKFSSPQTAPLLEQDADDLSESDDLDGGAKKKVSGGFCICMILVSLLVVAGASVGGLAAAGVFSGGGEGETKSEPVYGRRGWRTRGTISGRQ